MVPPEELSALDDFGFKQRMPSRAAAVRELFRLGLASTGIYVPTQVCRLWDAAYQAGQQGGDARWNAA